VSLLDVKIYLKSRVLTEEKSYEICVRLEHDAVMWPLLTGRIFVIGSFSLFMLVKLILTWYLFQ